jgi:hypothetical protein
MGATEEQMQLLADNNVTHVSYILILYSVAFLMYLFVNILLHIYAVATWPDDESNGVLAARASHGPLPPQRGLSIGGLPAQKLAPSGMHSRKPSALTYSDAPPMTMQMNGVARHVPARMPRHRATDSQQVRDAEEFELEGLMSDDEPEGSGTTGMTSPLSDNEPKERSKIGSGI